MGYSPKIKEKERQRILAQPTHKARVKESFKVAKDVVTTPISNRIQADIDRINKEIYALDKKDKEYGQKKDKLQKLLHNVASNYAIKKEVVVKIQDEINKILGVNRSDNT